MVNPLYDAQTFVFSLMRFTAYRPYVFRGEAKHFDKISSGLYRQYGVDGADDLFDGRDIEKRVIEQAESFTKETDADIIRAEIQHLGGKTNQIDFTKDLGIALFFACNALPDEDGRIICLDESQHSDYKIRPVNVPLAIPDAQMSVFVDSRTGYLSENNDNLVVWPVPAGLKSSILEHLKRVHGIETATAYNDISGFIRHQEDYSDTKGLFKQGYAYFTRKDYENTIASFSKYISVTTSDYGRQLAYYFRGLAYVKTGQTDLGIKDLLCFDQVTFDGKFKKPELPAKIREMLAAAKTKKEQARKDARLASKRAHTGNHDILYMQVKIPNEVEGHVSFHIATEVGYRYKQLLPCGLNIITLPNDLHRFQAFFWIAKEGYIPQYAVPRKIGNAFDIELISKEETNLPNIVTQIRFFMMDAQTQRISENESGEMVVVKAEPPSYLSAPPLIHHRPRRE